MSADLAENSVGAHQFEYGVLQSHACSWVGSTATDAATTKELRCPAPWRRTAKRSPEAAM